MPQVQVLSSRPRRNGLCSVPIFVCTKISHTLRRSSSSEKDLALFSYSFVNALIYGKLSLPTFFGLRLWALFKSYNTTRTKAKILSKDRIFALYYSFFTIHYSLNTTSSSSFANTAAAVSSSVSSQIIGISRLFSLNFSNISL